MIAPSRVRLGRARAGLGVAELAARCCVTPRSVSTWETRGAPEARAGVLAEAMAMPIAFLTASPLPEIEEPAVYFRARRRIGSALLRRSTAIGALGTAFYAELTALLRLPRLNIPECATADPAQAAQELRRAWRLGSQVVPNLVQLAEANGVRVLGVPQAEEDVDAFSFWGPHSHPYVFLTRGRTAERSRFDLAHELGHLVLHGAAPMGHERTDRSLEHEANRFAAAFLMPRDVVRAAVAGPASLDDLLELKTRLGVSAQAMAYALHDADRLSDWSLRQVLGELDQRGYLTAEPGSTLRHESSRVFAALASHLRGQHMSGTRWASRIGQRASDVGAFTLGQVLVAA